MLQLSVGQSDLGIDQFGKKPKYLPVGYNLTGKVVFLLAAPGFLGWQLALAARYVRVCELGKINVEG